MGVDFLAGEERGRTREDAVRERSGTGSGRRKIGGRRGGGRSEVGGVGGGR